MAISSKDIETLWKRYSDEYVKKGISVAKFFISYVYVGFNDGMKIEHHKLSYNELVSFIQKIQPLCLA